MTVRQVFLRAARLGHFRQLADYDWKWPRRIDRAAIEELGRGIQFIVNAEWTPEQAGAVFELLDDLRDCIWSRYAPNIQEFVRHQQAPDDQHPSKPAR
ncbi:hypothetical protein I6F15_32095 [Bradyrhizobium sp. BRP14]|nr:hypothetical protein [Bradyrhizobium sp. BRP14]